MLELPVSLKAPTSGPPAAWIRNHGGSAGCQACQNLLAGKKAGRNHNRACCRRYEDGLASRLVLDEVCEDAEAPRREDAEAPREDAEAEQASAPTLSVCRWVASCGGTCC